MGKMKTSSAFRETKDEFEVRVRGSRRRTILGTVARKRAGNLIEARQVTHSFATNLLALELVLDPSVEFLLKSSRVHPVRRS
jgi:hypothetical protein